MAPEGLNKNFLVPGYKCPGENVCCKGNYARNQTSVYWRNRRGKQRGKSQRKRICKKRNPLCDRDGGSCMGPKTTECGFMLLRGVCKGSVCSCCLGDSSHCGTTPACRFQGGYCIRKARRKKHCSSGVTDDSLCTTKKCSCCFPHVPWTCGETNQKIIGGQEVSPQNRYPWHVGLKDYLMDEYFCGGTLINDRYVLTAGHCAYDPMKQGIFKPKDLKVAVADHNQLSVEDDIPRVTKLLEVKKIIVHKNYDINGLDEDIALVRLSKPLDLTVNHAVKPVCLPVNRLESYEGKDAVIIGWGYLDEDVPLSSDVLMEAKVVIASEECQDKLSDKITGNMICAGTPDGSQDACSGDSGGSLVVREGGKVTLVGITSFGYGCGRPDTPGVYTRVTEYLDWILINTKDAVYCS
ncbi:trypsin-1-like isoform X2 [Palaemon carinicauda]|uniref:trypsin-1-like isoform X2 n=1 Tax=Palaemon carinicauda TaxID=392227 RepID=UPI0035B5A70A